MTGITESVWPVLARTTIAAGTIGIMACLLLRLLRSRSPVVTRCVCCAVLAQGWLVCQIDVPLPDVFERGLAEVGPEELSASIHDSPLHLTDAADAFAPLMTPPKLPHVIVGRTDPRDQRSVSTMIVAGWGGGLLCLLLWSIVSYAVLCSRIRGLSPVDARWDTEWRNVLSRLRIQSPVRMLESTRSGPLLCRTIRETVLVIPRDRWRLLSPSQREAVLLHEAAHLRRGDLVKSLLIRLLAAPQWFNPLAWWALRRFDDAAEWACDDFAASATGDQGPDYARALVQLSTTGQRPQFAISAAGGCGLTARIRRLLSPNIKEESRMKSGIVCVMFVLLTGVCVLRPQALAEQQSFPASSGSAVDDDAANDATETFTGIDLQSDDVPPVPPELVAEPGPSRDTVTTRGREAVVDMAYLFRHDPVFCANRENLKAELEHSEVAMRLLINQLQDDRQQLERLNNDEERVAREALESAVDELDATIQSRRRNMQRRFLRAESEMYYTSYQRISGVIADYARENGIRLVRQKKSVADQRLRDATPEEASDSAIDLSDHQAVLELLNRDIVYIEDGPLDITQPVLERLKRASTEDYSAY